MKYVTVFTHTFCSSRTQAVLTDAQRAQIEARREQMQARREAVRAATAEALQLTDEQQAALQELEAQHGEMGPFPRRMMHPGPGDEAHDALSSILNEEQMEVATIHRVLQRQVHQGHQRGPGPRG